MWEVGSRIEVCSCEMIRMGGSNRIHTCTHHVLQRLKDGHELLHHVRQSVPVAVPQIPTQVHCINPVTVGGLNYETSSHELHKRHTCIN